ncbi:MAG TPA: PAS domain S-box protein, partial [Methanospirillum sp.]|nr:PAS domain S-box protein [Methanospirillum sp.]
MNDDDCVSGLIVVLFMDGTIDTVIRDDLSLFGNRPEKIPFTDIIDPSHMNSFFRILNQICHEGVIHEWNLQVKGRFWSGLLHVTALVQDGRIWIAGSPVREWMNQVFEEAVSFSRQKPEHNPVECDEKMQMSADVYEELTRITNELINAQREIAAKNLQLEREKQEIVEKEKRYRVLFEAMEQGVVYQETSSGAIISANPAAERILGLSLDQMTGRTSFHPEWKSIREDGTPFPPEEHPSMISMKTGKPVKGVLMGVFNPKDKRYRWILIDATPDFRNGEESPYQVHTVFTDITRQKNLETALKEKTEYLEKLIHYANAPIITWNSDLIILEFNRAFEELTGIPAKDAKGRKIDILFPEKTRNESMKLIQKAVSGDIWETVEIPIRGKGGEVRTVLWNSANVQVRMGDSYITTTIAQGQDITGRKQAENALRQLNRQLNLMTSITRHDILNKVNVVQILCRLIRENPDQSNIMEHIDNIELAARMIEEQIAFTRLYQEIGAQEPAWQRIIPIIESLYTPEQLDFIITLDDVSIYADLMLEKVFYNLLDNSLRHGQTVTKIEVFSDITEEGLKIIWKDNGIGIPDEDKERIFERGYGKNTGLGMFFIRDILSLTGITICETGTFGKGAKFEIFVPDCNFRIHGNKDSITHPDTQERSQCQLASDTSPDNTGIRNENPIAVRLTEGGATQNVPFINEKLYPFLFENAGEAIFIIDLEGPEPGRIIDCNHEAARMNGYTGAELRNMNIFTLDPWKNAEIQKRVFYAQEGEWFSYEVNHKRKDGTIYSLEIRVGTIH